VKAFDKIPEFIDRVCNLCTEDDIDFKYRYNEISMSYTFEFKKEAFLKDIKIVRSIPITFTAIEIIDSPFLENLLERVQLKLKELQDDLRNELDRKRGW
jgi:hypothetical protein